MQLQVLNIKRVKNIISDVETRKKESIWKTNLRHKNVAFKTMAPWGGLDFKWTHCVWQFCDFCWVEGAVRAKTKAVHWTLLYETDILERSFKLCPHVAPGAIRLNHIPDMALRSYVFSSSLKACPMHTCVIGDLKSYGMLQLCAFHYGGTWFWCYDSPRPFSDLWELELWAWPFWVEKGGYKMRGIMNVQFHAIYQ